MLFDRPLLRRCPDSCPVVYHANFFDSSQEKCRHNAVAHISKTAYLLWYSAHISRLAILFWIST